MKSPRTGGTAGDLQSHPTRGAWIEIVRAPGGSPARRGRTPHGVRGLKFRNRAQLRHDVRRTPHGVRGLKSPGPPRCGVAPARRTPHGVRGLKSLMPEKTETVLTSHPTRGAWIEITSMPVGTSGVSGRTPHGVRGLKLLWSVRVPTTKRSHPTRGAWIEIHR